MGQLLDKSAILQFGQELITSISKHVSNNAEVEAVGNDILLLISNIGGDNDD